MLSEPGLRLAQSRRSCALHPGENRCGDLRPNACAGASPLVSQMRRREPGPGVAETRCSMPRGHDIEERGAFEERPCTPTRHMLALPGRGGVAFGTEMSLPCGADRRCAGARRLRQLRQFCKVQLAEHTEELPRQPVARLEDMVHLKLAFVKPSEISDGSNIACVEPR